MTHPTPERSGAISATPSTTRAAGPTGAPPRHVVVVGGGIGGLTAALELARTSDCRVTLLEAGDRVGGKLRLHDVAGHTVDVGAEAMLALRPEGVDLVESLGRGSEIQAPATMSAKVWSRGMLHPLPTATLMGIPASPEAARGLLTDAEVERALAEEPWPEEVSADLSVGDYVAGRLGDAVVDRLVEPLLGGVYAGSARTLSMQATMPAVWAAAQRGDSLTALAARAMGGGAPRPGARPPFAGVTGGIGRLPGFVVDALAAQPDRCVVRCSTIARELHRTDSGWAVVVGPTTQPERIDCDAVVLAVPPPATGRLLAPHAPLASSALAAIDMASVGIITLAVERATLPELPGSGFLVAPTDGHQIKASTFSATKWAWTGALSDEVVHLRASVGRAGEAEVLQHDDAALVDIAVAEIGEALGSPLGRVVDSHVQRWGGSLPQYAVGHLDTIARIREDTARLPGIALAGAAYDGVGIPAVIASAAAAAATVRAHLQASAGPVAEWGP